MVSNKVLDEIFVIRVLAMIKTPPTFDELLTVVDPNDSDTDGYIRAFGRLYNKDCIEIQNGLIVLTKTGKRWVNDLKKVGF